MGYIENLHDECLEKFKLQLEETKEENQNEVLFQMDFSAVSFSCSLKDGYKIIHKLDHLIKTIKKAKHQLAAKINELCSNLDIDTEQWRALSRKQKKKFKNDIKRILFSLADEYDEKIKKLKKIRRNILLRIGNTFLYIFTTLFTFLFGVLLYLDNIIINVIVYPVSLVLILGFVSIQVLYTVKYLKAINSTIFGIIDFSIKRAFSTLLVVWWYFVILTVVNDWNIILITYSFSAIFILNIVSVIYDLFLSSNLFDEYESTLSLVAAIVIGFVLFADSFNQPLASQVGSIFLLFACLLLTMLIIKKFLIDKQSIKTMWEIMYFTFIAFLTILFTITALIKLFWVTPEDGQVVDNTVFSAIMGVYAALLGGGLTLAGVAWTIKHNQIIRQNDRKYEEKPFFGLLNNLDIRAVNANEHIYHFVLTNNDGKNSIVGNFANSDKNCFILKKITIGEKEYTPDSQYFVSKEEIFQIRIFEEKIPNDDCKMVLVVEDQNGNEWSYNLVKNGTYIISMNAQQGATNE